MTTTITKDHLSELLAESQVKLIDARPTAAYNGWRLGAEARGGHIPGAIAFPGAWAEQMGNAELEGRLVSLMVTPGHQIVVYGDEGATAVKVVDRLTQLGYRKVVMLEGGFAEWAADGRLPVAKLPRYEQLVSADWLHDLLEGRRVEAAPAGEFAVFHATFADSGEYLEGHVPGAIDLDTNTLESPTDHNRRSPQKLEKALLDCGITSDKTVIVYGSDTEESPDRSRRSAGQIAATRAATILLYSGVSDVRVLDGGYGTWLAAGHDVETIGHSPEPASAFGVDIPARPELLIDLEEARELLEDPEGVLVSIRSWPEHVGATSGYNYIGETGDIPGAVWAGGGADAHDMAHYRNVDNTMKDYEVIAADWEEAGISSDRRIAFYCGTGWRASEAFFDAYLMGWPRIAIYDGGWFEWSRQTPVQDVWL